MDQACIVSAAEEVHHRHGPVLVGKLERYSGQGQTEETDNDSQVQEDMTSFEAYVLLVWLTDVMFFSLAQMLFCQFLAVFNKAADHPEQSVEPEDGKGTDQQAGHADKSPVADRVVFTVVHVAMGIELDKQGGGIGVTLSASADQVGLVDTGRRVLLGEHIMCSVTVGTASNLVR